MSGITVGQYVPGASVLHKLDARAKLLGLFALLAVIVLSKSAIGYAVAVVAVAAVVALSGLKLSLVLGSIRRLWVFFITIFVMNALFFAAEEPIWSWWIFHISQAGLWQGVHVVAHVVLLLILSNVLTLTTSPVELTSAIESLLLPLKWLRVPVEEVAMILSVAIRFIPTLLEEADMIRKAQIARGARFESRRLTERAASVLPLVIPIFLSAFRRADELSMAMEARGYRNASSRTKPEKHGLHMADVCALAASAVVCVLQIVLL